MAFGVDRPQSPPDRTRLEEALAWIGVQVASLGVEDVPLARAAGRILADDLTAAIDLPPFDRAAADGFALRADETVGASTYNPLSFRSADAADDLPPASALRVHAGDRLPRGADAVAALEQVGDDGDGACCIVEPVVPGAFVEGTGSHAARGSRLAAAGRRLHAADIGLLASAGIRQLSVVRRPRVRCLLAGRNVVQAGTPLPAGAVHDANGPLLASLVARDGGCLVELRRVDRTIAAIGEALTASGADVILVTGSSGPGPGDHAAAALARAGELAIHGVALRPGDTSGMGRTTTGALAFILPGAPAACLWGYELLAGRAIRCLGGRSPALPYASRTMTAARKIVSEIGMTEACPVHCSSDATVTPVAAFAEAGLAAATRADGFVIVPEDSEGYAQGAPVPVYLHDEGRSHLVVEGGAKP